MSKKRETARRDARTAGETARANRRGGLAAVADRDSKRTTATGDAPDNGRRFAAQAYTVTRTLDGIKPEVVVTFQNEYRARKYAAEVAATCRAQGFCGVVSIVLDTLTTEILAVEVCNG